MFLLRILSLCQVYYICDSTYRKVPVVGRLNFELRGCKVKISQNMVPKLILRFHKFGNLQYLIFKILEGFGAKTVFSCKKMDICIAKIPILCTDSQLLRALFSKSTFHQSILTSWMELPYLKNAMSDFKYFCIKIWAERTAI